MNPAPTRAAGRIADQQFEALESKLGYRLYAPTWLPNNGRPGAETKQGRYRILQDYTDGDQRSMVILAQERRSAERDVYHQQRFARKAEARADINGKKGYFVTGSSGERRLFWNEDEMAVIISSTFLADDDLVRVARSVR